MLSWLSTKLRFKTALVLAVLYAFCVLTPSVALAMSHDKAADCLTQQDTHSHGEVAHTHADGDNHKHDDKSADSMCCGLFSVTALASDHYQTFSMPVMHSQGHLVLVTMFEGRDLNPGIRPPIS